MNPILPPQTKLIGLWPWFLRLSPTRKGLLLGFLIPLLLSLAFGLVGTALGVDRYDSLGSHVIDVAVITFNLPGMIVVALLSSGMLGPGEESYSLTFLKLTAFPACAFWAFFGWCVGKSKSRR